MALTLLENEPLAKYTAWRIGGPARFFANATAPDQLSEALAWAREHGLPVFILGGGTNLLVRDAGFAGLVLRSPKGAALGRCWRVRLRLGPRGFDVAGSREPAALVVRAQALALWSLVRGEDDADRLFFDRSLVMEGDTELGLILKNTLDAIGPLWTGLPRFAGRPGWPTTPRRGR